MNSKEMVVAILDTQIQLHQIQAVLDSFKPMDPKEREFVCEVAALKLQFVRKLAAFETLIRIDDAMVKS